MKGRSYNPAWTASWLLPRISEDENEIMVEI
jgi:hypothetical protein